MSKSNSNEKENHSEMPPPQDNKLREYLGTDFTKIAIMYDHPNILIRPAWPCLACKKPIKFEKGNLSECIFKRYYVTASIESTFNLYLVISCDSELCYNTAHNMTFCLELGCGGYKRLPLSIKKILNGYNITHKKCIHETFTDNKFSLNTPYKITSDNSFNSMTDKEPPIIINTLAPNYQQITYCSLNFSGCTALFRKCNCKKYICVNSKSLHDKRTCEC